jgi:hypothetical protein
LFCSEAIKRSNDFGWLFSAVQKIASGPSRHFNATQQFGRFRSEADITPRSQSRICEQLTADQRGVGTTPSFFCRLDDDVVY